MASTLPQLISVAPIERQGERKGETLLYLFGVDRAGHVWTWNARDDEWTPLHSPERRGIALAAVR